MQLRHPMQPRNKVNYAAKHPSHSETTGLPKQTRGYGGLTKFLLGLGIQNLHYFDNVMLFGFGCTQRKKRS